MHTKQCQQCSKTFRIDDQDLAFYKKINVPEPKLCSDCRQQRRLAWRNESKLYYRRCDFTGNNILSVYAPDSPYIVYDHKVWWSDQWDALTYGQTVDFSRPFFHQFAELIKKVPRRNLVFFQNENSDYTNVCSYNKDCYLLFSSDYNQSCYYVSYLQKCLDCLDCFLGSASELCFGCVNFHQCYNCSHSTDIESCVDCLFCFDCKGCQNVAFSMGLRNKQYCIWNKQYSREEYFSMIQLMNLGSFKSLSGEKKRFYDFLLHHPVNSSHKINSENSKGDYLLNTSNCFSCYNVQDAQECKYVYDASHCKDSCDCTEIGSAELCYEVLEGVPQAYNVHFTAMTSNSSFLDYCDNCYNSKYLFGCVGIKKNEYCILNKQYSKNDYEIIRRRLIEHMKKTEEWGQFFPATLSPFAYNETTAHEYFSLSEKEVEQLGYRWKKVDMQEYGENSTKLPDHINDVAANVLEIKFSCQKCKKNYRIIPQEFNLYKKLLQPLPRLCADCRRQSLLLRRNPRQLWQRQCMCTQTDHKHNGRCGIQFETTYSPERIEIVYCESCYQKEIY